MSLTGPVQSRRHQRYSSGGADDTTSIASINSRIQLINNPDNSSVNVQQTPDIDADISKGETLC